MLDESGSSSWSLKWVFGNSGGGKCDPADRHVAEQWVNKRSLLSVIALFCARSASWGAPFGGIKESGVGRAGSRHGIAAHAQLKYSCMAGL